MEFAIKYNIRSHACFSTRESPAPLVCACGGSFGSGFSVPLDVLELARCVIGFGPCQALG